MVIMKRKVEKEKMYDYFIYWEDYIWRLKIKKLIFLKLFVFIYYLISFFYFISVFFFEFDDYFYKDIL